MKRSKNQRAAVESASAAPETARPQRWGRLRAAMRGLQTAWSIVGIALLLLLGLELAALHIERNAWRGAVQPEKYSRDLGIEPAPWIEQTLEDQGSALYGATEWQPFAYWRLRGVDTPHIHVDADGRRQTVNAPTATGGAAPLRIVLLGGSVAWGWGVRDEATIASLLAQRLEAAGLHVEVSNLAQPGFVSTQEVITLLQELQRGQVPAAVVMLDGVNDVLASLENATAGESEGEEMRRLEFRTMSHDSLFEVLAGSLSSSAIVRMLRHYDVQARAAIDARAGEQARAKLAQPEVQRRVEARLAGRPQPTDQAAVDRAVREVLTELLAEETVAAYEANVRAVEALAEAYGFTALCCWQPVVFTRRNPTANEQQHAADENRPAELFQATYKLVRAAQAGDAEIAARFPAVKEHVLDISGVFDEGRFDGRSFYWDFCHLSDAGNAVLAEQIATELLPLLKAPKR